MLVGFKGVLNLFQVAYLFFEPAVLANVSRELLLEFVVAVFYQASTHLNRPVQAVSVSLYVSLLEVRKVNLSVVSFP